MVHGFRFNTKRYVAMFTDISANLIPKRSKRIDPDDVRFAINERKSRKSMNESWRNIE